MDHHSKYLLNIEESLLNIEESLLNIEGKTE
jgi:hypothetical protein